MERVPRPRPSDIACTITAATWILLKSSFEIDAGEHKTVAELNSCDGGLPFPSMKPKGRFSTAKRLIEEEADGMTMECVNSRPKRIWM